MAFVFALTTLSDARATPTGIPFVFWHSQPVKASETLMLSGANFSPESTVELCPLPDTAPGNPQSFDLQGGNYRWQLLKIVQTTPQLMQAVMPEEGSSVYACRVRNGSLTGAVRRINTPDVWFAVGDQGETASPGGWIGVFGTCVSLTNTPGFEGPRKQSKNTKPNGDSAVPLPRLALVSDGKAVITVMARTSDGTRFGQFFDLPDNLSPGTYDVYVHNGHGGPLGWASLENYYNATHMTFITVTPRSKWPQTQMDVSHLPGANDDDRFATAIKSIPQGGVIFVAPGKYKLTKPLSLPNKCLLRGAGMEQTCIEWTVDPVDAKGKPVPLVSGAELGGSKDLFDRRGSFSIENLTLLASSSFTGTVIKRQGTKEPAHFHRITIRAPNLNPADARAGSDNTHPLAISLNYTRNLTVTECEIDARNGVNVEKEGQYLIFTDNHFRWHNIYFWLMRSPDNIVIAHNRFTMAGTWAGNGFVKADNANPGFSFAGYDRDNARGLYYANNLTDREEQEPPDGSIGITTDKSGSGSGAGYFGRLRALNGPRLYLAGQTSPVNKYGKPPFCAGASVRIVSGPGAGQSRLLVSRATASVSELEVDRPWEVEPDTNSWIAVSYFHGKALFAGNRFSCNPLLQTYFISEDIVYADNTIGVPGKPAQVVLWAMGVLNSWHYQVLDNQVNELGAVMKTRIREMKEQPEYAGPITCAQIYRNNSATQTGANFTIEIPDRTLGYLIEANKGVTDIIPGKDPNSLGLVRENSGVDGKPMTTRDRMNKKITP